jgi:hypothetical protein
MDDMLRLGVGYYVGSTAAEVCCDVHRFLS